MPRRWHLRLYIANQTARSMNAVANMNRLCEENPALSRCHLEIIDLQKDPALARRDQIVAIPTVIRSQPTPERRAFGDLSDARRVLSALDLPTTTL